MLKDWRFTAMTVAFFLAPIAINGTLTQVVALLTDRGVSLAVAVGALSASGIALTGGRIVSGFCLDKHPRALCRFLLLHRVRHRHRDVGEPAISRSSARSCAALGIGAEVDIMAFLVSRYFGLRSFGAVYATMFAFFSLGVGLGPFLWASSHDKSAATCR